MAIDWNKVGNSSARTASFQNSGPRAEFLELGKKAIGKKLVIRPMGSPEVFMKATIKKVHEGKMIYPSVYIVVTKEEMVELSKKDPNFNVLDHLQRLARNHPLTIQHNIKFTPTYAINVIDRADDKVKILEKGESIFGEFKKWAEITEKNPGKANEGADFSITVTGKTGKDYYVMGVHKNNTTFNKDGSPVSKEQLEEYKEKMYKLGERYKTTPPETYEKFLVGMVTEDADGNTHVPQANSAASQRMSNAARPQSQQSVADSVDAGDEIPF